MTSEVEQWFHMAKVKVELLKTNWVSSKRQHSLLPKWSIHHWHNAYTEQDETCQNNLNTKKKSVVPSCFGSLCEMFKNMNNMSQKDLCNKFKTGHF